MAEADDQLPFDSAAARERLLRQLESFKHRLQWHLAVTATLKLLLLTFALALLSFLIDRTFRIGFSVRLPLLLIGVGVIGHRAWQWLIEPLMQRWDAVTLADAVDRAAGTSADLAPRVATLLQLENTGGSTAMTHAAVRGAAERLSQVDWQAKLNDRRLGLHEIAVGAATILIAATIVAFPQSSGIWFKRWLAGSNTPWPQKTYLDIVGLTEDRRLLVPRGEAATVLVRVRPGSIEPQQITLVRRPANGSRVDAVMNRFAPSDFRHDLPPVNAAEVVEIAGGDDEPEPIRIEPIDRPRIEKLELLTQHPTDAKPVPHDFSGDDSDLRFLPQTAMRLRVRVSSPLQKFTFAENDVAVQKVDDRDYELQWTHRRPMRFQIELTASGTGLTSLVTPLSIGLLNDQPPRVSLAYSGVRQRITPRATIPITIDARDDFGLETAGLATKIDWLDANQQRQTKATTQPLFGPQHPAVEKDVQLKEMFAVTSLNPLPGALISIAATAADARYEGPQVARSKEATFRVVTPEELFKEILLRQQGERAKFRKLVDSINALRQEVAALTPTTAATVARKHRDALRETERISNVLTETLTEMRLNALGTEESYGLMQRTVIDPLKAVAGGRMVEQRDALDAAATNGPSDIAGLTTRQDRIIEQMNAILKQMAQWDSFVDVLNQLNEIIRLQEQAKQTTDRLKTKETNSAFD
ncbi:MAG: hypothetical protein QM754_09580 [Tepidisphaeraceae bacterium]